MNRATKAVISNIQATHFGLKSAALFHSTPVLHRKRRASPWDTRGSASKGSSKRANYYRNSRKLNHKQDLLRNVSAFAENIFQGLNYDFEEYEHEPSSSRGRSWFRTDYRDRENRAGGTNYKGPRSGGRRRGFQFCEDDDDIEQLFQSAFGGNKHFFWSFMSDEPPRTSSGYNYNSRYSSRWKWTHEEDYGTDPDKSESDLTSERKTLGLSSSGPLNADDVKIAYRKCAMKWHPDRHQGSSKAVAEEKFKVCSAAYQSLCDKLAVN